MSDRLKSAAAALVERVQKMGGCPECGNSPLYHERGCTVGKAVEATLHALGERNPQVWSSIWFTCDCGLRDSKNYPSEPNICGDCLKQRQTRVATMECATQDYCPHPARNGKHESYLHRSRWRCRACGLDLQAPSAPEKER